MYTAKTVSSVKSAFCPSASRRSAQCAYASKSSRRARRSAASAGVTSVRMVILAVFRVRLWSDDKPRDVLAGDGEVPVQIGGAAGEVAGQPAGDDVAIGAE